MAYDQDFDELLWDAVTVNVFSTVSAYGTPSYSTSASTYDALVEWEEHKVLNSEGQEVLARGRVFIGQTTTGGVPPLLTPKDRLTLSASWGSAVPRIVTAETYADESSGRYMTVAHVA